MVLARRRLENSMEISRQNSSVAIFHLTTHNHEYYLHILWFTRLRPGMPIQLQRIPLPPERPGKLPVLWIERSRAWVPLQPAYRAPCAWRRRQRVRVLRVAGSRARLPLQPVRHARLFRFMSERAEEKMRNRHTRQTQSLFDTPARPKSSPHH